MLIMYIQAPYEYNRQHISCDKIANNSVTTSMRYSDGKVTKRWYPEIKKKLFTHNTPMTNPLYLEPYILTADNLYPQHSYMTNPLYLEPQILIAETLYPPLFIANVLWIFFFFFNIMEDMLS